MKEKKDSELVLLAQRGDKDAFTELVRRYEGKVYALAYRIMGNREDASDILQDTFIQAFKKIRTFERKSAFSTWLYRIAMNNCLMKKRRDGKVSVYSIDSPVTTDEGEELKRQLVDWSNDPLATIENKETRNRVEKALSELPEQYREVVLLRDVDGLSNKEVAEILKISVASVKSRLHRGRLFLRNKLSAYFRGREAQ